MAVNTDDLSGITKHKITTSFRNLLLGSNYIITLDVTSPYTGLHTVSPTSYSFTASSDSLTFPVILTKNISVKAMVLDIKITHLNQNITSSNSFIIRCSSLTGC